MSSNDVPVALVTGAAGGIGSATVDELCAHGWLVVAGDIQEPEIPGGIRDEVLSERHVGVSLDVTHDESVKRVFRWAVREFGRLDLVVNSAGIQRHGRAESFAWHDWDAVLAVNLNGVVRCLREAGSIMLEAGRGSIVNIVSISAERGCPGRMAYGATKAAVISVTKTAAVEWASRGVRVNAVGPGYVDTELLRKPVREGVLDLASIIERVPMRRLATPREISAVIRFLGSESAAFVTGQTIFADGGFLADYGVPWSPASEL